MSQFVGADVAVAILIEDFERLLDLLLQKTEYGLSGVLTRRKNADLGVGIPHLPRHHREELGEVNCTYFKRGSVERRYVSVERIYVPLPSASTSLIMS